MRRSGFHQLADAHGIPIVVSHALGRQSPRTRQARGVGAGATAESESGPSESFQVP